MRLRFPPTCAPNQSQASPSRPARSEERGSADRDHETAHKGRLPRKTTGTVTRLAKAPELKTRQPPPKLPARRPRPNRGWDRATLRLLGHHKHRSRQVDRRCSRAELAAVPPRSGLAVCNECGNVRSRCTAARNARSCEDRTQRSPGPDCAKPAIPACLLASGQTAPHTKRPWLAWRYRAASAIAGPRSRPSHTTPGEASKPFQGPAPCAALPCPSPV